MNIEKILISACLMGFKVRYHGGDAMCNSDIIDKWEDEGRIVSICPEVTAGLSVPRASSEITEGNAEDVLMGKARVLTHTGIDRTEAFIKGAFKTLSLAQKYNIKMAVLKKNSPSCGNTSVYDGSFNNIIIEGSGVTARLLKENGVKVFNEFELNEANQYLSLINIKNMIPNFLEDK